MLTANDAFNMTDEMQLQVIWAAILSKFQVGPGNFIPIRPPPMNDPSQCFVSFNFKATPKVVLVLEGLGYGVQLTDPQPPQFMGDGAIHPQPLSDVDSYIQNGSDLSGHTTVTWAPDVRWPLYNWVSGSNLAVPTFNGNS